MRSADESLHHLTQLNRSKFQMSLVDYGSSDSENEPQSIEVDDKNKKRKQEDKEDPNDRPQKFAQLDNAESKLPPLPDIFKDEEPQNDNNTKKSSPTPASAKSKGSTLLPPQLWKKKANVTTEDTGAWNAERSKKTPPKPGK